MEVAGTVIGRESQLQTIDSFITSVREGPTLLALAGEAGIGKTTLWREGVGLAESASHRVLEARPAQSEEQLPFVALIDLFRAVPDAALAALPEPQRVALELALVRRVAGDERPEPQAVALAALGAIVEITKHDPVLIAIDDVQWLDGSTRRVMDFVCRRLRNEPVGILTAERTEEPTIPFRIDGSIAEDRVSIVPITPLSREDLGTLLHRRVGARIAPPGLARLYRICAGNPFFALEIARYLKDHDLSFGLDDDVALPASLRHLVSERLGDLTAAAKEVVLVAAAASNPTGTLLGRAIDGADTALEEAERKGVVAIHDDRVVFTHPLLASVAYSDAPSARRRRVHQQLADVTVDEERARHLALGADRPDDAIAAAIATAARTAHARGAPEAAADLALKAAALTEDIGRRAATMSDAASYLLEAGDARRARELLQETVETAPAGAVRAACWRELGRATFYLGSHREASDLFQAAIDEPGAPPEITASSYEGQGIVAWLLGDPRDAAALARRALDLAQLTDDQPLIAECTAELVFYEAFLGGGIDERRMESAIALEDRGRYVRILRRPTFWSTYPVLWLDDPHHDSETLEVLIAQSKHHGELTSLPWCLVQLVEAKIRCGRLHEAAGAADEAVAIADELAQEYGALDALICKSTTDGLLGRIDDAREAASAALEIGARMGAFWARVRTLWALAGVDTALGDHEAVVAHLSGLPAEFEAAGILEPTAWRFVPELIEAWVATGRADDAAHVLDTFEQRAHALERRWAVAVAARSRAWLDFDVGELDRALEGLDRAAELEGAGHQPLEVARTQLVRGTIERRANRKSAARTTLDGAARLFEDLGAVVWRDRARREIQRIGGRVTPSTLTGTETQIADLVAQGKSNPEIAEALFISRKTVEANLTRIYRKLGVRSRTELVRTLLADDST